jgi:hypothetical protein
MNSWVVAVAFLAGVLVCQVLILRYVNTPVPVVGSSEATGETVDGDRQTSSAAAGSGGDDRGSTETRCPHCGSRNESDAAFTYCSGCLRSVR